VKLVTAEIVYSWVKNGSVKNGENIKPPNINKKIKTPPPPPPKKKKKSAPISVNTVLRTVFYLHTVPFLNNLSTQILMAMAL